MKNCFRVGCKGLVIPYSSFCVKHAIITDFTEEEKIKQRDFFIKYNIEVPKRWIKERLKLQLKK